MRTKLEAILFKAEGPQFVRCRKDSRVVLARRDCEELTSVCPNFKQFLTGKCPRLSGLDLCRDLSAMRDAKL